MKGPRWPRPTPSVDSLSTDRLDRHIKIRATERFEELYAKHHRDIWRYCLRRFRTKEEAEEAFNSTFVVAWQNVDHIPNGDEARPWLFSVARNHIRNNRRKSERYSRLKLRLQGQRYATPPSDPADLASNGVEIVHQALGQLRAKDQELLLLATWENLSHYEISRVLGCSENAVAIRLHRARERLAKKLSHQQKLKDPPAGRHVAGQGANNPGKGTS